MSMATSTQDGISINYPWENAKPISACPMTGNGEIAREGCPVSAPMSGGVTQWEEASFCISMQCRLSHGYVSQDGRFGIFANNDDRVLLFKWVMQMLDCGERAGA